MPPPSSSSVATCPSRAPCPWPATRSAPTAASSPRTSRAVDEYLHYRSVDVSTVKELAAAGFPGRRRGAPHKAGGHRAMDDIRESVAELAYYRSAVFREPEATPVTPTQPEP